MTPLEKLIQARTELVLEQPFFGTLALKLKLVEDKSCATMMTNGLVIKYNPKYVETISLQECIGAVAHEVMHCANGHSWRKGNRDHKRFNMAGDYAINPILVKAKFKLPGEVLIDAEFDGMATEQIDDILARRQRQKQQQQQEQQEKEDQERQEQQSHGQGQDDDDSQDEDTSEDEDSLQPGEFEEAQDEVKEDGSKGQTKEDQEADWQTSVLNAAQLAQGQGKLPSGLEKLIDEIKHPKIDYKAALRKFFEQNAKDDYCSWPNKRYIPSGLYMRSLKSERLGVVVVYWDTSGSRYGDDERQEAANEVASIISECRPEKTIIIYADDTVRRVDEFEADNDIVFRPIGGGGTDFSCVFDWIKANDVEPAVFIGITDLMGTFPSYEPDYPVVWCSTENLPVPFGEVIEL